MRSLVRVFLGALSRALHCLTGTGPCCRFVPSCSEYARQCLLGHGPIRGSFLALRRISRCHPFGSSGWDPVPPKVLVRSLS